MYFVFYIWIAFRILYLYWYLKHIYGSILYVVFEILFKSILHSTEHYTDIMLSFLPWGILSGRYYVQGALMSLSPANCWSSLDNFAICIRLRYTLFIQLVRPDHCRPMPWRWKSHNRRLYWYILYWTTKEIAFLQSCRFPASLPLLEF